MAINQHTTVVHAKVREVGTNSYTSVSGPVEVPQATLIEVVGVSSTAVVGTFVCQGVTTLDLATIADTQAVLGVVREVTGTVEATRRALVQTSGLHSGTPASATAGETLYLGSSATPVREASLGAADRRVPVAVAVDATNYLVLPSATSTLTKGGHLYETTVHDGLTVANDLTVAGDVSVATDLTVSGDATVTELTVGGVTATALDVLSVALVESHVTSTWGNLTSTAGSVVSGAAQSYTKLQQTDGLLFQHGAGIAGYVKLTGAEVLELGSTGSVHVTLDTDTSAYANSFAVNNQAGTPLFSVSEAGSATTGDISTTGSVTATANVNAGNLVASNHTQTGTLLVASTSTLQDDVTIAGDVLKLGPNSVASVAIQDYNSLDRLSWTKSGPTTLGAPDVSHVDNAAAPVAWAGNDCLQLGRSLSTSYTTLHLRGNGAVHTDGHFKILLDENAGTPDLTNNSFVIEGSNGANLLEVTEAAKGRQWAVHEILVLAAGATTTGIDTEAVGIVVIDTQALGNGGTVDCNLSDLDVLGREIIIANAGASGTGTILLNAGITNFIGDSSLVPDTACKLICYSTAGDSHWMRLS
jgi:hypothetical protein